MAASDRYVDELCAQPWNGDTCPHGIKHGDISQRLFQFCNACLEYAMQGGE